MEAFEVGGDISLTSANYFLPKCHLPQLTPMSTAVQPAPGVRPALSEASHGSSGQSQRQQALGDYLLEESRIGSNHTMGFCSRSEGFN